jgi:endoglucanase
MAKKKPVRRPKPAPKPAARARGEFDLIADLCRAVAVSGDEGAVRRLVLEAIRRLADDVQVDSLGNVLAVKKGTRRERVLLAAHMDEVGFMVSGFEADGALRFESVGGVDDRAWLGKPVVIGARRVPGIIGAAPMHLLSEERQRSVVKTSHLRLDVGADSEAAAKKLVTLGERGTFASRFSVTNASFVSKALDDRLGVATLIELLRGKPYPFELWAAFTVQEEIGLRGAAVAAYAADPACAFVLDCTPANDLPDSLDRENTQYNTRLGHGPAIYVADRGMISDARLVAYLRATAEGAGIPYQFRQMSGGGTDAGAIHRARAGIPSVSVSVPHRYTHSPYSVARIDDWRNTVKLMRRALEGYSARVLKR